MAQSIQDIYTQAVAAGTIVPDAAQLKILPLLETIRSEIDQGARNGLGSILFGSPAIQGGLYLWGGVGRGKSMLMDMFVDAVQAPKRRTHFHAFMQEIHAGLHAARKTGIEDALQPVANAIAAEVRLLALDEMQINDITDAMIVGRLFEQLLDAGVVLVTTSNRVPDDLYLDGLNRALFLPFIGLLNDRLKVCELTSPTDYRLGQLSGRQVYFNPVNAEASAAIDAIWQDMAGGAGDELTLRVKGRETVLRKFRNGVARATFWDICGSPLGPADYLALANAVRVLILEDVPCLGRSNYNEAKRFVILIDTLYQAKTQLIMSAADEPERLYLEGSGSFEFERTASRLREMQSAAWGGR